MTAAREFDVIVAGELYTDLILSGFDFWPQPGQEAFARNFHRVAGGGTSITACGLARLGSRTSVLGVVGSDGAWLREQLNNSGVDTHSIAVHPSEPTAFTVAVTAPEDRAFISYAGANRGFATALEAAAARGELARARHVHLAYAPALDTVRELFRAIRDNGCTLSLDVGWHEAWLSDPRAMEALSLVDIYFPNETEGRCMTGESDPVFSLRRFADMGLRRVALKLGARGAVLLWDDRILTAEPYAAQPVDTTGAGDCFDAGFLYAWLQGETPERCLQSGNLCGARSTEAYGGTAGMPDEACWKREMGI